MNNEAYVCEGLKAMQNWCAWKLEERKGNSTKVPYDIVTGKRASSTDRSAWKSLDTVRELLSVNPEYNGLCFMISDGIIFVDVDHCIDDAGNIDERGQDILSAFPESYAEISQSGHGIHILTRGTIPRSFNNRKRGVEMYSGSRCCAYTGNAIQALNPTEEQSGVDYVFNKYSTKTANTRTRSAPDFDSPSTYSDAWVIRHASNIIGKKGHDFRTLFSGDTSGYDSASEADAALCVLLAFWCDGNQAQMDRIFRSSGLYRPKWEREDYRVRTLSHASKYINETFSEWLQRHQEELKHEASTLLFLNYGKPTSPEFF